MTNHGLVIKEVQPDHFIFGAGQLKDSPVNPSGQWNSWLPIAEDQSSVSNPEFEPYACVSFATLNCAESLIAKRHGRLVNYSDRWLAYASGTSVNGNDPHTVAETLRTKGDVLQEDWDYPTPVSWDIYYRTPPQSLYIKAQEFTFEYAFGHSWVTDTSPANLKKALTYSPLGVAVDAWNRDANGLYIRNGKSNHYVMLYGYREGEYWLVWDSYAQNSKQLVWSYPFEAVKRFTLDRNVKIEAPWQKFITFWRKYFGI